MSPERAVVVSGLVKRFGRAVALDGVDLEVPAGSVFGFLGPNGAGKTTTLRILTALARPTAGTASVLGHDLDRLDASVRSAIGYLPDVPAFYPWMTAPEFLRFAGRLFRLDATVLERRIGELLDMVGLAGVKSRIGGFSRGMRQRLGLAQALVNAPRLLLLDEPTSALDPIGRREVLEIVASLRGRTTVFFSTHILADVERVCDRVAILDRGRVAVSASVAELKRRAGVNRIAVTVDGDADALASRLAGASWLQAVETAGRTARLTVTDAAAAAREIPRAVAEQGLGLQRLETEDVSLEDVFVQLVGRGTP